MGSKARVASKLSASEMRREATLQTTMRKLIVILLVHGKSMTQPTLNFREFRGLH